MPFGYERLNERSQRPNALINFIKPLEGPDKPLAEEFLSRIAAQCYPVMKANHIAVMALEEYEPNPEFLGRNFNAGECIQLVLKNKQGQWLGFKYVQMVMMHELAHCKQMNHSRDFWKVRNGFAEDMEGLWKKKYSGEGVWGRGQDLATGGFMANTAVEPGSVPEHLCGGTYRRRGRKRKAGAQTDQKLTYAERQQKRIARKFGKHGAGNELGEDEMVRGAYEIGNRGTGKPRVANSKRGRELRAQAALARFGAAKAEQSRDSAISTEDESDDDWSGSEYSEIGTVKSDDKFVKICGDEAEDDEDANQEMAEMQALTGARASKPQTKLRPRVPEPKHPEDVDTESEDDVAKDNPLMSSSGQPLDEADAEEEGVVHSSTEPITQAASNTGSQQITAKQSTAQPPAQRTAPATADPARPAGTCPMCSMANEPSSLLCMVCSHVLRPSLVKGTWHCTSERCKGSAYLNPGDAGVCGLGCGAGRPKQSLTGPAPGLMTASILRWD